MGFEHSAHKNDKALDSSESNASAVTQSDHEDDDFVFPSVRRLPEENEDVGCDLERGFPHSKDIENDQKTTELTDAGSDEELPLSKSRCFFFSVLGAAVLFGAVFSIYKMKINTQRHVFSGEDGSWPMI